MTTISTQTIPTTSETNIGRRTRRTVSAFLAGAVLAGAAATGITAAVTNESSAPSAPKVVYVSSPGPADGCPVRPGPC